MGIIIAFFDVIIKIYKKEIYTAKKSKQNTKIIISIIFIVVGVGTLIGS